MKKVLVVGGAYGYASLFIKFGYEVVTDIEEASLICFTGGEDVSPFLYGEKPHPRTYSNTIRDTYEKGIFNIAVTKDIPMVGICRGGQFLNVMNGGKMYQHVTRHCEDHMIKDVETGMEVFASSTHHQMMRPGPGAVSVAVANEGGSKEFLDGYEIVILDDLVEDDEVVFYPLTKSLCFQPHPEFNGMDELQEYFFHCVDKYL